MLIICLLGVFETFLFPSNPSFHRQFNPAYLSDKKWQIFVGAEERFGLAELRTLTANVQINYYQLGVKSFGTDIYRENALELGYGFPVGNNFGAGLTTALLNCWIMDRDSKVAYAVKLGGIFLASKTEAGIWIGNINMPKFSDTDFLPLTYSVHSRFFAADQFNFYFAVMGMNADLPFFDFGVNLVPTNNIQITAGLNTENFLFEYGLVLALGKFTVNYSGNNHRQLGLSHEFIIMFNR